MIGMSFGRAARSIAARAGGSSAAVDRSSRGRSCPGSRRARPSSPSPYTSRPAPKYNPGSEDRPSRDRADVDVQQPGRRFHRARPRGLDGGPRHDQREDQPDDQSQPDEQGPRSGQRAERPPAAGPAPSATQATNSPTWIATTTSRIRDRRISGASRRGVTRYQCRGSSRRTPHRSPRTARLAARAGAAAPSGPSPQPSAPKTTVAAPAATATISMRPGPHRRATSGHEREQRGGREDRERGPPREVVRGIGDDRGTAERPGNARSLSQASTPNPIAHAATNPR